MPPAGLVSRGIATVLIAGSPITAPIVKIDLISRGVPLVRKELRQLVPIHFARRALGQRLDEVDDFGDLESGKPALEVVLQFRSRHIGPRHDGGLDLLTVDGIRNPERGRHGDRRMAEQHIVDLYGRDLLTAAIDQFLDATGDREITVAIENPKVAGSNTSVDD